MAIIEIISLGEYVKVCAIEERTGIEAVSILPKNLSRKEMEDAAMRKLKYVIEKKKRDENNGGGFTV